MTHSARTFIQSSYIELLITTYITPWYLPLWGARRLNHDV
jgi:hypothetical protein